MMGVDMEDPLEPSALTQALYRELAGLSLAEADIALDMARLVMWHFTFATRDITATAEITRPSPAATRLAARLEGLSLQNATKEIEAVRLVLWVQCFAQVPESAFARSMTGYLRERAADGAGGQGSGRTLQ